MANRLLYISRALAKGKPRWPTINCAVEKLPGPLVVRTITLRSQVRAQSCNVPGLI
jgi:hypothetical protein